MKDVIKNDIIINYSNPMEMSATLYTDSLQREMRYNRDLSIWIGMYTVRNDV